VSIDVTIETRDARHTAEVLAALREDGLAPQRIDARAVGDGVLRDFGSNAVR
jgi:threonine dehydratase